MYIEILNLKDKLEENGIPFEFRMLYDGFQILYPNKNDKICSVIQHKFSYGGTDDELEIMGLLTDEELTHDEVVGFLSCNEVFQRINSHYLGLYFPGGLNVMKD